MNERKAFAAWVADCGCDTDGAWSAWQARAALGVQVEPQPVAEKVLWALLSVINDYLPPDGIDQREALSRIIGLVDPWPLASPAQEPIPLVMANGTPLLDYLNVGDDPPETDEWTKGYHEARRRLYRILAPQLAAVPQEPKPDSVAPAQPWQAVEEADLAAVEAWIDNGGHERATFIPADAKHLANITMHMIREVRATRGVEPSSQGHEWAALAAAENALNTIDGQIDLSKYWCAPDNTLLDLTKEALRLCKKARATAGVAVPVVVDGRTEEQWCQEACRIGAYDYVEVIEGVKGRWIRVFTGERAPEKVAATIQGLKAQAERYDRAAGVALPRADQPKEPT